MMDTSNTPKKRRNKLLLWNRLMSRVVGASRSCNPGGVEACIAARRKRALLGGVCGAGGEGEIATAMASFSNPWPERRHLRRQERSRRSFQEEVGVCAREDILLRDHRRRQRTHAL